MPGPERDDLGSGPPRMTPPRVSLRGMLLTHSWRVFRLLPLTGEGGLGLGARTVVEVWLVASVTWAVAMMSPTGPRLSPGWASHAAGLRPSIVSM